MASRQGEGEWIGKFSLKRIAKETGKMEKTCITKNNIRWRGSF
jgi:hypothetical protein